MPQDYLGNPVTGGDAATIAAIDDFVGGMLGYEHRAAGVAQAADAAPDHCLVNVYAGFLHMLAETKDAEAGAMPYLARATAVAGDATARERGALDALRAWSGGDIDDAVAAFRRIVTDHPRDLLALKLLHYLLFSRGDFAEMLRVALPAAAAAAEVPHVHGMLAFAYEQCHLLDRAEAAARHALSLTDREPWAQHALAHVMLTQGRIDEGVAFLESARPTWTGLNSFMITHLWWHLALFYLSQGREAKALAAYDDEVWGVAKDYSQDQIGAVSLLARLEIDGVDIGARWDDLGGYLASRAEDVVQPFLSVQYLYGLARAGLREADGLLASIEREAKTRGGTWAATALPLARGLVAHGRGDFPAAVDGISAALPQLTRLGGSHAQRDLFEQLLADALVRSGDLEAAQQMLELRRAHDPDGATLNARLAQVYGALGLDGLAAEAAARERRRREA